MLYYLQGLNHCFCLYDSSTQRRTWMGGLPIAEALDKLQTDSNTFAENLYDACQQVQAWNSQEPPVVYTLADHPELFI